uniref:Uncharacterized protein n=1 Tax=Lotharella oceanica TaxID=641309 RepID=A0A7S2TMV9_9EUKA|mmetsp:Transcript_21114/g.39628  ORF Transcript_21114/g.39628 Transcript_21114/m.39628 type:complete len:192 (+) Transcript_21114:62-637(+)
MWALVLSLALFSSLTRGELGEYEKKFHEAALAGNAQRIKEILDKDIVDVNVATDHGETALFLAAEFGHLEAVKVLMEAKAKVDIETDYGRQPVWMAAKEGYDDVVMALIQADDIDHAQRHFYTVLITLGVAKGFLKHAESVGAEDEMHLEHLDEDLLNSFYATLPPAKKRKLVTALNWLKHLHNNRNKDEL